jgi:hypothetical protein
MKYYPLSIFFNLAFFILIGLIYNFIIVEEPYLISYLILLLIGGGLFYAPAYLISNIPMLFKKRIKSSFLRLVVFPVNLSIIIFGTLFIISVNIEIAWLFFIIAQLLSSIVIFSLSNHS